MRALELAPGLEDATLRDYLQQRLQTGGVRPDQLLLEGRSLPEKLLGQYHRIDVALDTQPYSGGLTTCEALWMGVPAITFPGRTFAGRHATSYLSNADLTEFIAPDVDGYVNLALQSASRLDDLAVVRSQLRDRLRNSPVCNAAQFATDFLAALRNAFEKQRATI